MTTLDEKPENPPAPPEHEPGCPQEGVIGSVECCKPAPRDERQEARRLLSGIACNVRFSSGLEAMECKRQIETLGTLFDSVCEQRDEARRALRDYDAGIEFEHIQNTGETFSMTIKRLTRQRDALKEQLAGAHAQNCDCHGEAHSLFPESPHSDLCSCCQALADDDGGEHDHPHVDPSCAEMRKGGKG